MKEELKNGSRGDKKPFAGGKSGNVKGGASKAESKYLNTARLMDEALILLLDKKEYEFITVKDVCEKAGVNRSTFYLHYESKDDLLSESYDFVFNGFFDYMGRYDDGTSKNISAAPLDKLFFITPQYLTPFFEYVKENRRIFSTVIKNLGLFELEKTYAMLFKSVFEPILARFNVKENETKYIMAFSLNGLMAIVTEWLKTDCTDSVESVVGITMKCINFYGKNLDLVKSKP